MTPIDNFARGNTQSKEAGASGGSRVSMAPDGSVLVEPQVPVDTALDHFIKDIEASGEDKKHEGRLVGSFACMSDLTPEADEAERAHIFSLVDIEVACEEAAAVFAKALRKKRRHVKAVRSWSAQCKDKEQSIYFKGVDAGLRMALALVKAK